MPIKTLGSLEKIRVDRGNGNTHIFFFGLMTHFIADTKQTAQEVIQEKLLEEMTSQNLNVDEQVLLQQKTR